MGRLQEQRERQHALWAKAATQVKVIHDEIPGPLGRVAENVLSALEDLKDNTIYAADGLIHSHHFEGEVKEQIGVTKMLVEEVPKLSLRRLFGKRGNMAAETTFATSTRVSPVDPESCYRSQTRAALLGDFEDGDSRLKGLTREKINHICTYGSIEQLKSISAQMGYKK
jgi:hypothetical protein